MFENIDLYIQNWANVLNESDEQRYLNSIKDEKNQDDLFRAADEYEDFINDIDKYYQEVEKTGKIEGNLTESDAKNEETSEEPTDETTDEAMSADEIMRKFDERNKELAAAQKEVANKVKTVDLTDVYDGYVAGKATLTDGSTNEFEFDIPEEEITDMREQLEDRYSDKGYNITDDDAVVALVRLRIDPTDTLDWFYTKGSHQTSLDMWFLDQEIERENRLTTHRDPKVSWAEYAGLLVGGDDEIDADTEYSDKPTYDDYDDIDFDGDDGDAFTHMRKHYR
jgi:hypothetical protein